MRVRLVLAILLVALLFVGTFAHEGHEPAEEAGAEGVDAGTEGEEVEGGDVEGDEEGEGMEGLEGGEEGGAEFEEAPEEETPAGPTDVVSLTSETFDEHIKANEVTLVEFYAPWCGHCKALAPEYEKTATALKGQASVSKVDCTRQRELCSKYEIQGFPTIKLFRNDDSDPSDYEGGRRSEDMIKFVQKQKGPAYVDVKTVADLTQLKSKEYVVVGFIPLADANKDAQDVFVEVAKALRNDYDFGLATDPAFIDTFKLTKTPALKIFRNFDEPEVLFDGEFNAENVINFVDENSLPLLGEIGPENYQKYILRGLPLVWIFLDATSEQAVLTTAREVSREFRQNLSFVHLDRTKWADHAKNYGLEADKVGIVLEDQEKHKNFVYPQSQEVTRETLRTFCAEFVAGTLKPTIRSQAPPATNSDPVKVVVGSTFDELVMDKTKDVLVEFYAPWCGHCKQLAPIYDELAQKFLLTPSVVVAKIDATENDSPIDVKGYPTIVMFPANGKDAPIHYEGDRALADLEAFINEHASTIKASGTPAVSEPAATKTKEDL